MNYIEERKQIYLPVYLDMVRKEKDFEALKNSDENLFIIEVDGPKSVSNEYYRKKYGVDIGNVTYKDFVK